MESYQTSHGEQGQIRTHAVIGSVQHRACIGLSGPDRASYLQGLLTNDMYALRAGAGCYAAWLTPQGRMLTDMHVFESGDMVLLDVPAEQLGPTLERLDQFLFSEDVQIADLSASLATVWIHGPRASGILASLLPLADLERWPQYRNERTSAAHGDLVIARVDQLGVPGFCTYVAAGAAEAWQEALRRAGAVPVGAVALEAARIEAGYPLFGLDMDADTIPLEAGIEARAISLTKGCYVGQEVIIRVLHRGQGRVARKLVSLIVHGSDVPTAGAVIHSGARAIGRVTSAASSSTHGLIALGYVHRDFTGAGSAVEIESGTARIAATVSARPIPTAA